MKDEQTAAAALDMIAMLEPAKGAVMFDLTLHGVGQKYDLAKLLVEPPFPSAYAVGAGGGRARLPARARPFRTAARGRAPSPSASGRWSTPRRRCLRRAGRLQGLATAMQRWCGGAPARCSARRTGCTAKRSTAGSDSATKARHGFTRRFQAANEIQQFGSNA
ncbi:hypothetical protein ACVOMV_34545 [Mesorhizobium atlanticum]